MLRLFQSGKINPLLALVGVGVALLGGAVVILATGDWSEEGPAKPEEVEYTAPEIVSEISDSAPDLGKEEVEEEETPKLIKTVDTQGHFMFVRTKPVEVWVPGKGPRKMKMFAKSTNVRGMQIPDKDKKEMKTKRAVPHPSVVRKGKRSKATDMTEEGKTAGGVDSGTGGSSGESGTSKTTGPEK